jgi:hypothetical protein
MTSTVAELAADVFGIRLGITDIQKTPTPAQLARVERLYSQKYAEMAQLDKVYWASNAIPDLVVGALSRIIAAEMCPGLGMAVPTEQDDNGQVVSIGVKGKRMLNELLARELTGLPTQAEYF